MGDQGILTAIGKFIYSVLFPLVPGAVGSALALKFLKDGIGRTQLITSFFGGLACAGYGGPAICELAKISGQHVPSLIGFFVGLFGLAIIREMFKELNESRLIGRMFDKLFLLWDRFFGAKP